MVIQKAIKNENQRTEERFFQKIYVSLQTLSQNVADTLRHLAVQGSHNYERKSEEKEKH